MRVTYPSKRGPKIHELHRVSEPRSTRQLFQEVRDEVRLLRSVGSKEPLGMS